MKLARVMVLLVITVAYCEGKAALRRKPKVYNALITTDEDLEQSRAFPVIQPTIHESGIAHYPFNPYGIFNQHVIRLGQPIAPALSATKQPYSLPSPQIPPQLMQQPLVPQAFTGYPLPQTPPTAPEAQKIKEASITPTGLEEQPQPTIQPPSMVMAKASAELSKDPEHTHKMPMEQLPIPLNQYGFPPALIPLRQPRPYPSQPYPLPNGLPPFHLPPYRFNPFPPVYYNSLTGLRQQFLPPYDYLPTGPQFPLSNTIPTDKTYPHISSQPLPPSTAAPPHTPVPTSPVTLAEDSTKSDDASSHADPLVAEPSFENIKNGSKSKDSNVPDVPPPPIPSGAKSKQS